MSYDQFTQNMDPSGLNGFGQWSQQEVESYKKALETGGPVSYSFGTVAPGNAGPLRLESLEGALAIATFREKHIKMFRMLRSMRAYQLIEQVNVLDEYGQEAISAVSDGGSLPDESDSTYRRTQFQIKYRATSRRIALPQMLTTSAHGPLINMETSNGMKYMLRGIERDCFFGRDDLDVLQWQGLEQQIEANAASVIDLRGGDLDQTVVENESTKIGSEPRYGEPNLLMTAPQAHSRYSQTMFPRQRVEMNDASRAIMAGEVVTKQKTSMGDVTIDNDVFLSAGLRVSALVGLDPSVLGPSGKVPTGIVVTVAPAAAPGAGQFGANDAGTYFYWAIAYNSSGRTAPVQLNVGALTVADGDIVTFTLTPTPGPAPKWYEIYRTRTNDGTAGNARRILRVKNTAGGGPLVVTDTNARLPGCVTSFLFSMKPEEISLKTLLPMVRIPLPNIDLYTRWAQAYFACIAVRIPSHHTVIRNVFAEY